MSNLTDPRRWEWNKPAVFASAGFLLMTFVAVGQFLRVIERFAVIFKELGVLVPFLTQMVLCPWFHVVVGLGLVGLVGWRHRVGRKAWATAVWIVILLTYIAISHAGLFEPLFRLIDQLGAQATG